MRLIVKSTNLDLQAAHRDLVQQRVNVVFNRTHQAIQSITVTLSDVNGPKGGPDKQVKVSIKSDNLPTVMVVDQKSEWLGAVNSALSRANNAFMRKTKRRNQFRHRDGFAATDLSAGNQSQFGAGTEI